MLKLMLQKICTDLFTSVFFRGIHDFKALLAAQESLRQILIMPFTTTSTRWLVFSSFSCASLFFLFFSCILLVRLVLFFFRFSLHVVYFPFFGCYLSYFPLFFDSVSIFAPFFFHFLSYFFPIILCLVFPTEFSRFFFVSLFEHTSS